MRLIHGAVLGATIVVAACTQQQLSSTLSTVNADVSIAAAAIQSACDDANAAVVKAQATLKGGALNTANGITPYIVKGCASAETVAALAADPSSQAWLGSMTGSLNTLVSVASGAPPAAAPAPAATTPAS